MNSHKDMDDAIQSRVQSYLDLLNKECGQLLNDRQLDRSRIEHFESEVEKSNRAYKSLSDEFRQQEHIKEELYKKTLALEQKILELETGRRVYCLIDGDGAIFSSSLLLRSEDGGKAAAALLSKAIQDYLNDNQVELFIYIFVNKRGLQTTLQKSGLIDEASSFEGFFAGFNQANRRFLMVDVGYGKEMADARMRSYLEDYCRTPSTWKIIFGGCHDNGYAFSLQSLITTGFREKIVLLPSYTEIAAGFRTLDLPSLVIDDLFRPDKLVTVPAPSSPAVATQRPLAPSVNGSWGGTGSPPKLGLDAHKPVNHATTPSDVFGTFTVVSKAKPKVTGQKKLTTGLPLLKHNPRPCNMFYLTDGDCKFGNECTYGHHYLLQAEHYEEMRENARKGPCPHLNLNANCPYGDKCIHGHRCPQGPKCYYRMLGKCKFVGDVMHKAE